MAFIFAMQDEDVSISLRTSSSLASSRSRIFKINEVVQKLSADSLIAHTKCTVSLNQLPYATTCHSLISQCPTFRDRWVYRGGGLALFIHFSFADALNLHGSFEGVFDDIVHSLELSEVDLSLVINFPLLILIIFSRFGPSSDSVLLFHAFRHDA